MTLLASDGMVLAADRRVSIPDYDLKSTAGKISFSVRDLDTSNPISLGVSGAGSTSSLEYCRNRLISSFNNKPSPVSLDNIASDFQNEILKYHQTHITSHNRQSDVLMIVLAQNTSDRKLWVSDQTVVNERKMSATIGVGSFYADSLLGRLWAPMDTVGAILLAAYIIWEVKNNIEGCGSHTDLVAFPEKQLRARYINRYICRELEDIFERYSVAEATAMHELFADRIRWSDTPSRAVQMRRLKRKVNAIIQKELIPITSQHPQPTKVDRSHQQP